MERGEDYQRDRVHAPTGATAATSRVVSELLLPPPRIVAVRGPRGSGTSATVIAEAHRAALQGAPARIVTVDTGSATRLRDRVATLAPTSLPIRVMTTGSLAREVLALATDPDTASLGAAMRNDETRAFLQTHVAAKRSRRSGTSAAFAVLERSIVRDGGAALARVVNALRRSWLGAEEIVSHAEAASDAGFDRIGLAGAELGDVWALIAEIAGDLQRRQRTLRRFDRTGMLVEAATVLRDPNFAARVRAAMVFLGFDDYQRFDFAEHRLAVALLDARPTNHDVDLDATTDSTSRHHVVACSTDDTTWRRPGEPNWHDQIWAMATVRDERSADEPADHRDQSERTATGQAGPTAPHPDRRVIRCGHRSLAIDAAVGELVRLHRSGEPWETMCIVVPFDDGTTDAALRRIARRHEVPLHEPNEACGNAPIVAAMAAELLRTQNISTGAAAAEHRAPTFHPDTVWRTWLRFAPLALAEGADATAAATAFITALRRGSTLTQALAARLALPTSGVHVARPSELVGFRARTVIILGALEGIWPEPWRVGGRTLPDVAILDGPEHLDPETARAEWLHAQQLRFQAVVATASQRCLAIVAPEPGVLPSRFVEGWPVQAPTLVRTFHDRTDTARTDTGRTDTGRTGPEPIGPDRTDPDRTDPDRTGPDRTDPDRIDPNRKGRRTRARRPAMPRIIPGAPSLVPTDGPLPCFPSGALRLSATQLDSFQNCPLNFAFTYACGIRGPGGAAASTGTMVHRALELFLLRPETERTLDQLLDDLELAWDRLAFDYRPQEADYRRRAEGWLRNWFERELPNVGEVIALEHRFSIELGAHRLVGSIDRVSRDRDGVMEIVDYKTGSSKGIDPEDNLQLAVYHLAASNDPLLQTHGKPERLRLHFLAEDDDLEQTITDAHEQTTRDHVLALADQILAEDYQPNVHADCEYCTFKRVCPIQPEGLEIGDVSVRPGDATADDQGARRR